MKDYGRILMWSAIVVSMPRWAGAFISADVSEIPKWVNEALHYGNLISGFGMGFLEVLAAAYMLDAWGKLKPKKTYNSKSYDHKWKILTGFIIGLFVLMPLILAPYIVSRMTAQPIGESLGNDWLRYVWSIAVVLSPVFIVGGVSVANGELVEVKSETKEKPKAQPKRETKTKPVQPVSSREKRLTGTRALVYEIYKMQPRATQQEVAEILTEKHGIEISRQAIGKHKRALNGVLK